MVNIIVILFVYYCEINAEKYYLKNKETVTADFQQNPQTDHADMERLQRRSRKETETNRYTTGSREDNNGLSEFHQSDSEGHFNIFFKPGVVNSRRFNNIYTVDENIETGELNSENIIPNRRKKYHHHSRKNMTKKDDSANNEGKEIHKKDEKEIKENDSSSGSTTTTTIYSSSSSKKFHTQKTRFKIKDRDDKKKSKHPKDMSMSHEREKDKKKHVKEKSKDQKEEKRTGKTEATHSRKNDKTTQFKGKRTHKQIEPSKKDKSKGPMRIAKENSAKSKTTIKVTKPKPTPAHKYPKEIKKVQRQPVLRAHKSQTAKHIRPTKLSALSLDKGKKKGQKPKIKMLRQENETLEKENINDDNALPLNLSPYAITAQINELMKEFPAANVSVTKSASTVEYNDIITVTIREGLSKNETAYFRTRESKYIDDVPEKKIIFIVHGLTVMGLKKMDSLVEIAELKLLLSYYLKHLDKFDFILMPLANPDGYSASLASDQTIWNKNASPQDVCSGVFLDRNFDVMWNDSHNISSCSQLYPGPTAFSEEESKAVRDVLHRYSHKILAYIHVHAGTFDDKVFKGEAVLYPKGFTLTETDDDKYIDMKGEIDEAMKNASFRVMTVTVDTLARWYGLVQGTSVDYAASVFGIPYALEFVMQIYETDDDINRSLTEIWSRLIDTTFNNMWKSLQRGADNK